jgi:hypothetical protein
VANSSSEVEVPITITLLPNNADGSGSNLFYAIGTLAFSGNYPTGGDTLDFTQVADKLPSTQIIQAVAESQNGKLRLLRAGAGNRAEQLEAESLQRRRHRNQRRRVSCQRDQRHRPNRHHRPQTSVTDFCRPAPIRALPKVG